VFCATDGDVAEALAVARRFGLPAVPAAAATASPGVRPVRGMVIDVTPMRSVSVTEG
jgi:FAD/FMN-containing dehydrogenase